MHLLGLEVLLKYSINDNINKSNLSTTLTPSVSKTLNECQYTDHSLGSNLT